MAVGLTLIFGVMRVVNFAHGDMMVWGMYLAWLLATRGGADPYASFFVCAAVMFVAGLLVQRALVQRIVDAPHEMQILLILGVALVLENAALLIFGPEPHRVRSALAQSTVWLGPVFIDVGRLVTFGVAIVLTLALSLFLFRTDVGRSMRAAADNTYGALVIGTDVRRVYAVAFGVGEFVIGATVVAVGTSVPELATAVISKLRGHDEVGLGTILGSNIFNGLFIIAVAACIHPIAIPWREVFTALVFGVIAVACSYPPGGGFIERRRGVLLLALYAVYLATVLQAAGR